MLYVVPIIIVAIFGYIGKQISKVYVLRDYFYAELINLCEYLKNNISFKEEKINDMLSNYSFLYKKEIEKYLNINEIDVTEEDIKCFESCYFLKDNEREILNKFFKELGDCGKRIEIEKIESILMYLKEQKKKATENKIANCGMIYKISLAVGAVVSILIM